MIIARQPLEKSLHFFILVPTSNNMINGPCLQDVKLGIHSGDQ